MVGEGGRAGHGGELFRAARGDPPAAHLDPLPPSPDRGALREKQRAEKLLEDALLKLSVVVSDLHGVSSREIMEALIGGCRDPKALAQLARGRLRAKVAALEEALDGADTFTDNHAFVLRMMLDNIDHLTSQVDKLTAQVEELIAPCRVPARRDHLRPGFASLMGPP